MQCNERLFGRPVEARNPATGKVEIMVLQGLSVLDIPRIGGTYPYAICEDSKGILRVMAIDDMRFIDSDISSPTAMTIRRYSLVPIQEEDLEMLKNESSIDRMDIYDDTRQHNVRIKQVVTRTWENPDKDYQTESWNEAIDYDGNCYRAGMLYWEGAER